ncbi:hypothetical protein EV368DRAFT_90518 [Lentinula lateritia]|nr:hypothetical protein EV368DRAFT_90518 [Lentinula lateritia]
MAEASAGPPGIVHLVFPPGWPMLPDPAVPSRAPSPLVVPCIEVGTSESVQGPSFLAWLASLAKEQSKLVQQFGSLPTFPSPIKGTGPNLLSSTMPPAPHAPLVPCPHTIQPSIAENQHLLARVQLLESQLADLQQENSTLTTALWDTSHSLEACQREVEQLRTSNQEIL